jgi:hypothetical protein
MSTYRIATNGNILRADQKEFRLNIGDRFFDRGNGRWAILLNIRPETESLGAPFEALYDGCSAYGPFVGYAMHADIGDIIKV